MWLSRSLPWALVLKSLDPTASDSRDPHLCSGSRMSKTSTRSSNIRTLSLILSAVVVFASVLVRLEMTTDRFDFYPPKVTRSPHSPQFLLLTPGFVSGASAPPTRATHPSGATHNAQHTTHKTQHAWRAGRNRDPSMPSFASFHSHVTSQ